ncbi:MAG: glycosyltransferase [Candidatus Cloacimonetes bacterium]|nr:glycosyltransferase [Candidatus Cloacimonadota bacterium]
MKKKILILTISHIWFDTRVFYKIVQSLLKMDSKIRLITNNQINSNKKINHSPDFTYHIIPQKNNKIYILFCFILQAVKFKPDIVICVEPLSLIAGFILKQIFKCRLVYDNHEFYVEAFGDKMRELSLGKISVCLLSKLYWCYESYFAKKADSIITVNDHLLKRYKYVNQNVFLCANYLIHDTFKKNDKYISKEALIKQYDLIYVGSLAFERGLNIYLKTAKLFKKNKKPFTFLIIGNFKNLSTEKYFFNYIKYHHLHEYIIYKPYMPNEQALIEMKAAKIGVFMGDVVQCKKYHKTTNMKIFEYFSQSIPVIVNKLDNLSELVYKSKGGWTINFDDKALYNLSVRVLNKDNLVTKKGECGYKYTKKHFIWENQEPELYEAILG